MDHREATRLGATEKYLLGELPPAQRDAFEEHYFGCRECAADVRLTAEFLDAARHELARAPAASRPVKRSWLEWRWQPALWAPACAVLLAVTVYQSAWLLPQRQAAVARLRAPSVVTPVSLIGANSRGALPAATAAPAGQPLLLSLDIPTASDLSGYVCMLVDARGTVLWELPISAAQARDIVSINVPAGSIQPGSYALLVRASRAGGVTELARYPIHLSP